jgi:hypothetical protein
MDPDTETAGFHRSIVLKPGLLSNHVIGSAVGGPDEAIPVPEPTLAGLGVTFGSPDLTATPTAGRRTRLTLPVAKEAAALLPDELMMATRWDALDAPTVPAPPTGGPGTGTPAADPDADPGTTASVPAPERLVVPERPGEVVAPVRAKRLASGGFSVPVTVPSTPGLYRLVATVHEPDGDAYDAATQALIPALIVRVTGPINATYGLPATATATAARPFSLAVTVTNLGRAAWGKAAVVPDVGVAEMEPAIRATLVGRWVDLGEGSTIGGGTGSATGTAGGIATAVLPAGMTPGSSIEMSVSLTAPTGPGEYLLVFDVLDPQVGSLAATGVPPGIVRVTVTR